MKHRDLAYLCFLAYQPSADIQSTHEVDCLRLTIADTTVLAFRGTETDIKPAGWSWQEIKKAAGSWWDVVYDLRFMPAWRHDKGSIGRNHRGFLQAAERWLNKYVVDVPRDLPVIVTGHSLGAGTGAQVARLLQLQGYDTKAVFFGEPAGLYDKESQDSYRVKTTTYTASGDWIQWAQVFPWAKTSAPRKWLGGQAKYIKGAHSITNYIDLL